MVRRVLTEVIIVALAFGRIARSLVVRGAWNRRNSRLVVKSGVNFFSLQASSVVDVERIENRRPVKYPSLSPNDQVVEEKQEPRPPIELDEVTIVEDISSAQEVVERLMQCDRKQLHGVDTEVADIDLNKVGPVGHGRVTCITIYSGPDMSYDGIHKGTTLWIDTTVPGVMDIFKAWLEDDGIKKVWHNYGFDRHVLNNHNIEVKGFAGDTMHMARLLDAARQRTGGGEGYSLESLSADYLGFGNNKMKVSMKQLFNIKSASLDIDALQTNPETRSQFICYAAYDAKCTLELRDKLALALNKQDWVPIMQAHKSKDSFSNMLDFYQSYFVPFGELLTDMERIGIFVDKDEYLAKVEERAIKDKDDCLRTFRDWTVEIMGPDGYFLNPSSAAQIQTLLYGGSISPINGKQLESERVFDAVPMLLDGEDWPEGLDRPETEDANPKRLELLRLEPFLERAKVADIKLALSLRGLPTTGTKKDILVERLRAYVRGDDLMTPSNAQKNADTEAPATNKDALQVRIQKLETRLSADQMREQLTALEARGTTRLTLTEIDAMKMKDLRLAISERGVQTSGAGRKKTDIQRRLMAALLVEAERYTVEGSTSSSAVVEKSEPSDHNAETYASLDTASLRGHLLARGISPPEKRDEVLDILGKDEAYARDLRQEQRELKKEKKDDWPPAKVFFQEPQVATTVNERDNEWFELPVGKPLKKTKITVCAVTDQLVANKFTASGFPSVTAEVLSSIAGTEKNPGPAYHAFGGGDRGMRACEALRSLCRMGSIDKMLNSFIRPLRQLADDRSRVHCSLNLNTETGRLSSRRPNLQNQPALEKDMYSIRRAFRAEPGKKLVVADYGQLELRLLAAITNCKSMLDAFESGGCFHSRTAVGMFPHVKAAVENNEVLLERGAHAEDDDRPLVKDKFASERRKAKTLNFSIAYGKTAHGLAKDWDVSREDAQALLTAWYDSRPEVKRWQDEVIKQAKKVGYTTTLMGRRRQLPDIQSKQRQLISRGARAAINTPIQGSAADVVMMAMLKLHTDKQLKELGWKLLLQIHDEVILEGPEESADEALAIIRSCMEYPFDHKALKELNVALTVDAKSAYDWYEAK